MLRTEWTTVGQLRALVHVPDEPVAALVLVDGSGEGCCDDWGGWVERIAELGAVVLTHDRAGCGGSPGNWLTQTLDDRAAEEREALAVLRKHAAVTGPVGLLGFSQGGWVGMLAAADADFLVSLSGPGVGPAAQERHRIEVDVRAAGVPDEQAARRWTGSTSAPAGCGPARTRAACRSSSSGTPTSPGTSRPPATSTRPTCSGTSPG